MPSGSNAYAIRCSSTPAQYQPYQSALPNPWFSPHCLQYTLLIYLSACEGGETIFYGVSAALAPLQRDAVPQGGCVRWLA